DVPAVETVAEATVEAPLAEAPPARATLAEATAERDPSPSPPLPRRARRPPLAPVEVPARPPPAGPSPTGFLAVGGPGAVRRVVYVDGQRRDFAPLTLELPARSHVVELRDTEGAAVAERRVEIREDHTRRSPLRWIVPAPPSAP